MLETLCAGFRGGPLSLRTQRSNPSRSGEEKYGLLRFARNDGFNTCVLLSPRDAPEVCCVFTPSSQTRAQGKPGARCTHGLACKKGRETHTSIQVQRKQSGLPCAMVLTASFVISPAIGFFATVACSDLTANLTPASRRQDHTTSPSALAPFVKSAAASIASNPASVTIAIRPSSGVDGCGYEVICGFGKPEYFFGRDWTDRNSLIRLGKLDFTRKSAGGTRKARSLDEAD